MFASLAQKLLPHLSYLIAGQVVLLGIALMLGGYIFLRYYFKKRPFDGDPTIESKEIALQIQAEITRLTDLRNRVAPGLADTFSSSGPAVVATPAPSIGPALPADATNADPNAAAKIAELETLHKKQVEELTQKLGSLEAELAATKLAGSTAAPAGVSADSNKVTIAGGAAPEELQSLKQGLEKEKSALAAQVTHLEAVISEYKIFEEDFALVKKYKTENDDLKNQITALTSQVNSIQATSSETLQHTVVSSSQQGFSTPIPSQQADSPASTPANPKMTDEDISNLFASFENPSAAPTAAPEASPPDSTTAPQSQAPVSAPAPQAELANTTPPASASEIEAFFKEQETTSGSETDAADALLAELAAAQSQSATPAAAPSPAPETPAAPGFDSEKVSGEPKIASQSDAKSDLETLAESAASDDQLMEEFQKLLESEKT